MAELPPLETNTPCLEVCWVLDLCLALIKAECVCTGAFLMQRRLTFREAPAHPDARRSAPVGLGLKIGAARC